MTAGCARRIGAVIAGALRQALRDSGAVAIMIAEPTSPEGAFLAELCSEQGVPARPAPHPSRAAVDALGGDDAAERAAARAVQEAEADRGNLLGAHPANRTALLLARPPAAPLLPLGDVPGSVIAELRGDWSAPAEVCALAEAAGGIDVLDECLYRWLDRREAFAAASAGLAPDVANELRRRVHGGRFHRRRAGLVVKLGQRTIGHDLQL